MDELLALREHIEKGRYQDALLLMDELEEMSREDKINKIYTHGVILLMHLIKQQAEQRNTRSWEVSIFQSADQIKRTNKRRKAGGFYADREELLEILNEAYELALKKASLEVFGGRYCDADLAAKVDKSEILGKALQRIVEE